MNENIKKWRKKNREKYNEYMKNYMKDYYVRNRQYRKKKIEQLSEKDKERYYRIQQDVRVLRYLRKKRGDDPDIDYSFLWDDDL